MTDISDIKALLKPSGLVILGVTEEPRSDGHSNRVLVGNAGSSMWPAFSQSAEFNDGLPDPLDRWSRRIGCSVADALGADILFPFEGPPYPPVLDWAASSGQVFPSPLSMSIHHEHGLWHAYRFILCMDLDRASPAHVDSLRSPCLDCDGQPCLDACPVDAFSAGGYQVNLCVSYLVEHAGSGCETSACRARRACPVARGKHYLPAQARFHMDAFLRSRRSPDN